MKRLHIHLNTAETSYDQSVNFYSTLFDSAPTKERGNYAKWMLEDPKMNFVVEVLEIDGDSPGVHHVGIQVDESAELDQMKEALKAVDAPLLEIGKTACCYSESEKNGQETRPEFVGRRFIRLATLNIMVQRHPKSWLFIVMMEPLPTNNI